MQPLSRAWAAIVCMALSATHTLAQNSTPVRVSYPASARAEESWQLSKSPVREFGGADDTTDFRDVHGVRLLPNGRIAIANAATNEVRIFDEENRLIKSFGRSGSGPGEFRQLWLLFNYGDTLIAIDSDESAERFTEASGLRQSLSRPSVPGTSSGSRIGVLSDGRLVISARRMPETLTDNDSVTWRVVAIESRDGRSVEAKWLVPRAAIDHAHKGTPRLTPIRFAPFGQVVARGDRICSAYSSSWTVRCIDAAGNTALEIRRVVAREPLSAVARQDAANRYRGANARAPKAEIEAEVASFRFAEYAPALGALEISENGDVWVSDFHERIGRYGPGSMTAPARPVNWHVFDRRGRWLATVTLPPRFVPYDFSRTAIAGITFDEDAVERVTVWGITRAPARR
jgi:hypothetical protein